GLTSAITGLTVGLTSSTNSQNKTGISFDLSGGTGGIYYDLLGTGSTWSITRAGALTVASCSGCGSSSGYSPFQELQGAIVPNNSTMDLLVGGQATTSAKFAITNVAAGTPIATLSASTNNNGLVLSAVTSTIQSLRNNALILGGDTTGEVTIAEITNLGSATTGLQITTAGQISDIDGSGVSINDNISLVAGTSRSISIIGAGGGSLTIQSSSDTTPSGVGGNLLLAGGSGSNDGSGGTIYIYGGTGGTKGNVILANNGTTSIGLVGIGTATPLASFDVRANINNGGTISVASVSGTTSFAALVANNDGVGDLFTASASSQTRFVVKNNGQLLANAYPTCTLKTDNTGLVTCGTDNTGGAGTSPFAELSGAIVPNNSTEDFLVGGQSTTSAVFSILNVAKNQPVASASGQFILMPNNGWGGQVGIGYNNPGTATLAVNGNVGIGTTAPLENLAVGNGITNQSFSVASASNNKMYFSTWYDTAYFSINRNSATGVFANTSLGAANLGFISDSTGGYFEFNTANSPNSNPVFRMRLDENGNLGIGTNSPTAPLQVNGAYGSNAGLIINQLNNGDLLTASYSGITKFNVSNTGKLVLGTSTNGLTFDPASGPTYNGTAQLVKKITLSPEYAGATLTASGSATTTGTMTADASPSANWRTYYQWSSTQGTMQDYTLALRVTLPNDFSAWATSNAMTIDFDTATTNATQNKLDVLIFNPSDAKPTTPVLMNTANVSSAGYTWTTNTYPATSFTGGTAKWQTAGQTAVIYLHMYSASPGVIQVGDIVLNYYAKF
ncbi:MAG: hypothetical protein M1405_02010, partial [Patescibacteria group bacterium]|nr:hypothetical protein [Patescibacteria group bacterium]